jgi:hypothetical protein
MHPSKSNRVAWSVAVAALALWATSAQATFGQAMAGAARVFDQTTTQTEVTTTTTIDAAVGDEPMPPCPPVSTSPAPVVVPPVPTLAPPATDATATQGTFHLCGPDPATEQAIAQLVAGRGFSASLVARGDGCADLTIRASGSQTGGSSSSQLSVSLGGGQTLKIDIESAQGATHASIGG